MSPGDSVKVILTATDGSTTSSKEYTFQKVAAAAKVKLNGAISYVDESNLADAFADSDNADATFTLLADVARTKNLDIKINCTLDLGGHTIHFTGVAGLNIFGRVTATIQDQSQDHRGQVISDQSNALVGGKSPYWREEPSPAAQRVASG